LVSDSKSKAIIFGGFSQIMAKLSSLLFFFFLSPWLIGVYGFEVIADWAKVNSIFLVLSFLDFGNNNKTLNDLILRKDDQVPSVQNVFFIQVFISLIVGSLLSVFYRDSVFVYAIFVASFQCLSALTMKFLEAQNKLYISQISLVFAYAVSFPLILLFISNPKIVFALIVAPSIVSMLINLIYLRIKFNNLFLWERFLPISKWRFSIDIFLYISLLSVALNISDTYLLRASENALELAHLELLKKTILLTAPLQYFILPMWPLLVKEVDDYQRITLKLRSVIVLLFFNFSVIMLMILILPNILPTFSSSWDDIPFNLIVSVAMLAFCTPIFGFVTLVLNHPSNLKRQCTLMLTTVVTILLVKHVLIDNGFSNYIIYAHLVGLIVFYLIPSLKNINVKYV
jgi:hypothetical protein